MKNKSSHVVSGTALVISIIALTISYTASQKVASSSVASVASPSALGTSHEYLSEDEVLCRGGFASVVVHYRDSIDHEISVRLEVPPESENSVSITCDTGGFHLNGVKLSLKQLAESAHETRIRAISKLVPRTNGGGIPVFDMTSLSEDQLELVKRHMAN